MGEDGATSGQWTLLLGLLVVATLIFAGGITVIWLFVYGPL